MNKKNWKRTLKMVTVLIFPFIFLELNATCITGLEKMLVKELDRISLQKDIRNLLCPRHFQ